MKNIVAVLLAAGLLTGGSALAQDEGNVCAVPGLGVMTDPAGDQTGAPATSFADLLSLSIAEPASTDGKDRLVFTYKMSDLAVVPPSHLWIVRFTTDVPPANGDDEYWVAMLTGPDGAVHFLHGTDARVDHDAGTDQGPGLFTPVGALEPESNYNADGTITLVLDKAQIGGVNPGQYLMSPVTLTTRITPTDGTMPFMYGFRSVSSQNLSWDDTLSVDEYEIEGNEPCEDDKSILGVTVGALPLATLAFLVLAGLAGLRRRG